MIPTLPSTPRPPRGAKAGLILAFCAFYIAFQLFVIVRGHFVTSKHFAFWMFPESTYFNARLSRVLNDGREVKANKGAWTVETTNGLVKYKWKSFVTIYRLDQLEKRVRSKGTFDDTLKYFQNALNYVAARIPQDESTSQLVLTIRYQRAGGPKQTIVLKSEPRFGVTSHASL